MNIPTEREELPGTVNWNTIRNIDVVYFSGIYYNIIFKGIIKTKRILYLSSFRACDHVVVEVDINGKIKHLCAEPDRIIPFGTEPTSQKDCNDKWFKLIKEAIAQE